MATKRKPPARPKRDTESIRRGRFVKLVARYGNHAKAAREAGYSERNARQTGYELLQIPEIAEAVRLETKRVAESLGINEEFVLIRLKENSDQALEAGQFGHSIRAAELIGKHHRMFTDQVDHTIGLRKTHEEALAELDDDGPEGEGDQAPAEG